MGSLCTATSPQGERFVALDSLRGLAAVAVLLFHIGDFGLLGGLAFFKNGWLLVDFFFVLSGFVIAASYGERLAGGYSRWQFMALRLGRVVPLHLAVVAAFVVLEFTVFRPWLREAHDTFFLWRGALLLDGLAEHTGNFYAPVSWSISVEVMLYIAAAALFAAGRWGFAIALGGAVAALIALASGYNGIGFGFLLQRGVLGFAVGVAVHCLHRRGSLGLPSRWLTAVEALIVGAALWLVAAAPFGRCTVIAADALFGVGVLVFARDRGWVSRALQARPWVALGTLSYSIYMIHILLVICLNRGLPRLFAAVGRPDLIAAHPSSFGLMSVELGTAGETLLTLGLLGAVIALSRVTYNWIEEPARRWSRARVRALAAGGTFLARPAALSPAA